VKASKPIFKDGDFLGLVVSPRQTNKLEDQPLSDVLACLFGIFEAILYIRRPSISSIRNLIHALETELYFFMYVFKLLGYSVSTIL
jgi:hypothetical protein